MDSSRCFNETTLTGDDLTEIADFAKDVVLVLSPSASTAVTENASMPDKLGECHTPSDFQHLIANTKYFPHENTYLNFIKFPYMNVYCYVSKELSSDVASGKIANTYILVEFAKNVPIKRMPDRSVIESVSVMYQLIASSRKVFSNGSSDEISYVVMNEEEKKVSPSASTVSTPEELRESRIRNLETSESTLQARISEIRESGEIPHSELLNQLESIQRMLSLARARPADADQNNEDPFSPFDGEQDSERDEEDDENDEKFEEHEIVVYVEEHGISLTSNYGLTSSLTTELICDFYRTQDHSRVFTHLGDNAAIRKFLSALITHSITQEVEIPSINELRENAEDLTGMSLVKCLICKLTPFLIAEFMNVSLLNDMEVWDSIFDIDRFSPIDPSQSRDLETAIRAHWSVLTSKPDEYIPFLVGEMVNAETGEYEPFVSFMAHFFDHSLLSAGITKKLPREGKAGVFEYMLNVIIALKDTPSFTIGLIPVSQKLVDVDELTDEEHEEICSKFSAYALMNYLCSTENFTWSFASAMFKFIKQREPNFSIENFMIPGGEEIAEDANMWPLDKLLIELSRVIYVRHNTRNMHLLSTYFDEPQGILDEEADNILNACRNDEKVSFPDIEAKLSLWTIICRNCDNAHMSYNGIDMPQIANKLASRIAPRIAELLIKDNNYDKKQIMNEIIVDLTESED